MTPISLSREKVVEGRMRGERETAGGARKPQAPHLPDGILSLEGEDG